MTDSRGAVFIAPVAAVASGKLADPETTVFWASWQDDGPVEDRDILGAKAAISWGRERAEIVLIRLAHTQESYFTAGERVSSADAALPAWPPSAPPSDGWYTVSSDDL